MQENKVDTKKIFNKYMKPFLEEHGFKLLRNTRREIVFVHKEKSDVSIGFNVNQINSGIDVTISGGMFEHTGMIRLTQLCDGPENIDSLTRGFEFYYNDNEELLGILEYQEGLFKDWIFDWMLGKKYTELNIYKIIKEKAEKRAKRWENIPESEKWEILIKESDKKANEWNKTRFYPKKWKLED